LHLGMAAQHARAGRAFIRFWKLHTGNPARAPDNATCTNGSFEQCKMKFRHGLNILSIAHDLIRKRVLTFRTHAFTTRRQAPPPDSWSDFTAMQKEHNRSADSSR
jgi:hypothetical protein